ncbi:MAG: 5-dehydro-4-deoxyglucarate dehydratase [Subtercola sp.]|nr:5-dehydro-4-deoxyglucarate dehydratase [Subtercola sp.]
MQKGEQMLDGLLFFPVTPFTENGEVDAGRLADHIDDGILAGAGAVFVACGTGEFHAMDLRDFETTVRAAVEVTGGRVDVVAGVGGAQPFAKEFTRIAAGSGADGTLVLPPYLVNSPGRGLVRYVDSVVSASPLPAVVYQRNNAVFDVESARELAQLDQIIGFKDGTGDLAAVAAIREAMLDATDRKLRFFNGTPTAELNQFAYRDIGVDLYSSAVFAFAPEIALAFFRAYTGRDEASAELLLDRFYRPFAQLRDQVEGYAISLIKAGLAIRGKNPGSVRAPLVDVSPDHIAQLHLLIDEGMRAVDEITLVGAL